MRLWRPADYSGCRGWLLPEAAILWPKVHQGHIGRLGQERSEAGGHGCRAEAIIVMILVIGTAIIGISLAQNLEAENQEMCFKNCLKIIK